MVQSGGGLGLLGWLLWLGVGGWGFCEGGKERKEFEFYILK